MMKGMNLMINFRAKREKINKDIASFNNILSVANKLLESNAPSRLYDLIYSMGKPYQLEVINSCIKGKSLSTDKSKDIEHLFFENNCKYYRFIKEDETGRNFINYSSCSKEYKIHPSESLIFTFPWEEKRLIDAFINIGEKVGDKWKHDPLNHRVTHILPLNIGYVTNGYHSSAMNIISNESPMIITEELNLAPIYKEIYTDGQYFRRKLDDTIIDRVASVEFAAIFEIGRLLIEE